MFKDKVYENLDDISKLIEPYESSINEELSQFPDEIEITKEKIMNSYGTWGWSSVYSSDVIFNYATNLGLLNIANNSYTISRDFFKVKVKDLDENEKVIINLETNEISHKIFMVKTKIGYDDIELEKMAKRNIISAIKNKLRNNKSVNKSRLNELAELYNAHNIKSDRTYSGKVRKFCIHLESLIDDKKLNIKNLELCSKFGQWVALYISEGNLPALNNITRIKIMMHENRPIYSIEEKETL